MAIQPFSILPLAWAGGSLGGASSPRPELRGPPTGNHGCDFLFPPPSPPLHVSFLLTPTHALAHSFPILSSSSVSFPSHTQLTCFDSKDTELLMLHHYKQSALSYSGSLKTYRTSACLHLLIYRRDVGSHLMGLLGQCNEIICVKCYSSAWRRVIAQCLLGCVFSPLQQVDLLH